MKLTHFFALATLFGTVVACQSDQEQELTQTSGQAMSSTHKELEGAPSSFTPNLGGARVAAATTTQQQQMLTAINQVRSQPCQCGTTVYPAVPALTLDAQLNSAADKHAIDMAAKNYFSHTSKDDGAQPWDRIKREGYDWQAAGENIAGGYATPAGVVSGWKNSPGHCVNMMSSSYANLGVGYAPKPTGSSNQYANYWVADFGLRKPVVAARK